MIDGNSRLALHVDDGSGPQCGLRCEGEGVQIETRDEACVGWHERSVYSAPRDELGEIY